jgi:uncharacterized membrane protein
VDIYLVNIYQMDVRGLLLTLGMAFLVVWAYIIGRWGIDGYSGNEIEYFLGTIPCFWIYIVFVFILIIFSMYIYFLMLSRENAPYLISIYYILIILSIAFASWWYFESKSSTTQYVGLLLVALGLIVYIMG